MGDLRTRARRDRRHASSGTGFEAAPGIFLLLSCLLTAIAAHTSAGGVAPGPAGLMITVLLLVPIAAAVNRISQGPLALACAGVLGQLVAHVSMSLVTPMRAMPSGSSEVEMATAPGMGSAAQVAGAHGGGAGASETMAALSAGGGMGHAGASDPGGALSMSAHPSLLEIAGGHLLHMGLPMAAAHLGAAALTAILVPLAVVGLRRAASSVRRVLLQLWTPQTPLAPAVPVRRRLVVPELPYLEVLGGRAPPALS